MNEAKGVVVYTRDVMCFGTQAIVACDGLCSKAWGINNRPKLSFSDDPDDHAFLADCELGEAPKRPGTYEGGWTKPDNPRGMNKWCSRECERSVVKNRGQPLNLPDFSRRVFNQPWKHSKTPNVGLTGARETGGETR